MKRILLASLMLTTSISAEAIRLPNGDLVSPGDNISKVYRVWGRPDMTLSTEKVCNRVVELKRNYCSRTRDVWFRNDTYYMFQRSGRMVIKDGWTRNKRSLRDKF